MRIRSKYQYSYSKSLNSAAFHERHQTLSNRVLSKRTICANKSLETACSPQGL